MFKWTPQQDKWYKERAYIKYKRQGYFAKDYRQGQRINTVKSTSKPQSRKEIKSIREYIIKSFAFCYNNYCLVY